MSLINTMAAKPVTVEHVLLLGAAGLLLASLTIVCCYKWIRSHYRLLIPIRLSMQRTVVVEDTDTFL